VKMQWHVLHANVPSHAPSSSCSQRIKGVSCAYAETQRNEDLEKLRKLVHSHAGNHGDQFGWGKKKGGRHIRLHT